MCLTCCLKTWYLLKQTVKDLRTSDKIVVLTLEDTFRTHCLRKANKILKEIHLFYHLFSL